MSNSIVRRAAVVLFSFLIVPTASAGSDKLNSIVVYPSEISLNGPRAAQEIVVVGQFANGEERDVTAQVVIQNHTPEIIDLQGNRILPHANGTGKLLFSVGDQSQKVNVSVSDFLPDSPVQFTREVVPVLTKMGCNQGACHGAQHGKGGFRLSLLGFDPAFDYSEIVQSAEGRRIVLSYPGESLILQKPSLALEHGGGERLKKESWQYERIRDWLAVGAPAPDKNDPMVRELRVFPPARLMQPGESQKLIVQARWSDGRLEDVTALSKFDSLNEGMLQVTDGGVAQCVKSGETYAMVRFGGQAAVFQSTSPYEKISEYPALTRNNFIDKHLENKWRTLGLRPSELCSEEVFLRRIYLDTIGTLPTIEEVEAFLEDDSPDKRAKAIENVLDRPEFVDFWAVKWGDLLRNNRKQLQDKGMWSLHNWIRAALRDEVPIDEFVSELVTAKGSAFTDGPANFYRIGRTPADWAEATSQVFLGVRMQCAKCHHHPFEKWSQEDYYGMAAFFSRVRAKNSFEFGLFGRETVVYTQDRGEQRHPRKGYIVKPHPLDGEDMDDPFDRRIKLAEWMTSKDNMLFARNIVNRFWGYYFGKGIVEPLDDMRATNPPSNPELLDAVARDFVENGFQLKHMMRTMMNSRAYQLSALTAEGNLADAENKYFARYSVKRLSAEQLADAVDYATGTREKYPGLPLGTRAIQLPDPGVRSYFLDVFGRPVRQITCECERTMSPNIAQALHLMNGDLINNKISNKTGRIARAIKAKKSPADIVEELYLVTLCRPPKEPETETALGWIQKAPNVKAGAEDLLWALLNSREFLFNH